MRLVRIPTTLFRGGRWATLIPVYNMYCAAVLTLSVRVHPVTVIPELGLERRKLSGAREHQLQAKSALSVHL